ncbi:MAG: sigma-70 family RNA polymerase sigma factor [Thermoanaerobaculia bacterium]|nr:sigma-70 family RNA polymerase sigma factor [Thermoanaerobaculia bacterium]MBP9824088.1 sigma-70 family RNA polymerase sigma factor [Thermoanaerobaculia bacterium]
MARRAADPEGVTELLQGWREGDEHASALLLEKVYATLKRIALGQLRGERSDHTLQPTALVHEAYLRILGQRELPWRDRAHFFGLAAVTMRRVLVDHARRRSARKRDAEQLRPITITAGADGDVDLLDLDRALTRFAEEFPRPARVVEMRYFSGLELAEVATALDISLRTAERDWRFARAWLRDALAAPA